MTSNILDKIIELLPEKWRIWILPILLIWLIVLFVEYWDKKKLNSLKEALTEGNDYLDEASKKFIKADLSKHYFKKATGLDIEQEECRKALMELYQKDNCPVNWDYFRRVIKYMEYDNNNKITGVKIPIVTEMLGAFSVSLGMAMAVMTGFSCRIFATSYKVVDISDRIVVLLFMAVCIVFGLIISIVFICRPYLIYTSAKFVNRHAQKGNEKYIPACLYEKIICYEYSTLFHSWVQRLVQWSWVQRLVQWSWVQRLVQWLNEQWRSSLFPLVRKCWWLLWVLFYYIVIVAVAYLIICFYFKNV